MSLKNVGLNEDDIFIYTKDTFKCGICKAEKKSIDDYVIHMLEEENCILVLETSSFIKDLLLPKFKKSCTKISEESGAKDAHLPFSSDIMIEIEVGQGIRRWKCKICCLTFSRQAALINHFKLAKHPLPKNDSDRDKSFPKVIKKELKETNQSPNNSELPSSFVDQKDDIQKPLKSAEPTCYICGQIFKSDIIVESHIKIVHSEKRPFECGADGCNLSFKTKGSLVRHMRRHTGDRPYKCLLCNRSYRESGSLLRHQQSKIPCNKKPDKHLPRYGMTLPFLPACKPEECKIALKKERIEEGEEGGASSLGQEGGASSLGQEGGASSLGHEGKLSSLGQEGKVSLRHEGKISSLGSEGKVSSLGHVGKVSLAEEQLEIEDTKAKVRKEIYSNQANMEVNFSAPQVAADKKPLINLKDLKKEYLNFDSEENKDAKELEDKKDFGDLEEQVIRRNFTCPICYKVYTKMTFLSTHMKIHLAELGNECSTCYKRFSSDHALSRHLLTHSFVRQFECRQCGKTFKHKSHVVEHFKCHSTIKSVPCSECGRLFKSVSSRNNHLKIHKGERNFECSLCFKKFLVKASFIRHMRVHNAERPFQCPHCKQGFKEHGTLNRHIKFKRPCSQLHAASTTKRKSGEKEAELAVKEDIEDIESRTETLSEINDTFSEADSELESFLSENFDLSSIYSEHSDIAFSPKDYLIPHLENLETLPVGSIKQEMKKD